MSEFIIPSFWTGHPVELRHEGTELVEWCISGVRTQIEPGDRVEVADCEDHRWVVKEVVGKRLFCFCEEPEIIEWSTREVVGLWRARQKVYEAIS